MRLSYLKKYYYILIYMGRTNNNKKEKKNAKSRKQQSTVTTSSTPEPVEVTPPAVQVTAPVTPAPKKRKTKKTAATTGTAEVKTTATVTTKAARGAKKVAAKSGSKKQTAGTKVVAPVEEKEKRTRSFKVQLPGCESFEGRFTGLTPYQAANKALSKYYRETENPDVEITFSIRESTRGSKRSTYSYTGRREKLEVPVEYSIQDGRVITKNYKNRLIKIKKAQLKEQESAVANV